MQKITYTNNAGKSAVIAYAPPYVLSSVEGLGGLPAQVQSQKSPYQQGATFLDAPAEPRPIPITFMIKGRDYKDISELRQHISSVFDPRQGEGILRYQNKHGVWEINCVPESSPYFPSGDSRGRHHQGGTVDLLAHNPYWRSLEIKTEPLSAYVPMFTFPFSFPVTFGERGSEAILVNDGDVPAPVEIEFNGPAVNPIITNETTGEYIRVIRELFEGDKLIINTAFGRDAKVQIVRDDGTVENGWGYIDIWESTLFKLDTGENRLTYNALSSGAGAVASVSYRNMYVGV